MTHCLVFSTPTVSEELDAQRMIDEDQQQHSAPVHLSSSSAGMAHTSASDAETRTASSSSSAYSAEGASHSAHMRSSHPRLLILRVKKSDLEESLRATLLDSGIIGAEAAAPAAAAAGPGPAAAPLPPHVPSAANPGGGSGLGGRGRAGWCIV